MIPSPSTPSISPLRQRMLEDMRMRKLEPRTQEAYIRAVRKLAAYLKRSPDAATVEDLRNFQLHCIGRFIPIKRSRAGRAYEK